MRELYIQKQSPIHHFDARVKLIFTLAFILSVSLMPSRAWPAYILFQTLLFSITLLSRINPVFVLKRALLAIPFIIAAFPLIFTGPLPHKLISSLSIQIIYSPDGLFRFFSIGIKSFISIQAAILLTTTTNFPDILNGLRFLKVPKIFIAIIGLMWRYLFIISEEVTRLIRARASRSGIRSGTSHSSGGSLFWRARVTGGMTGNLLLRSIERSDRVYAAMLSRGYSGELPPAETAQISGNSLKILFIGMIVILLISLSGWITGG